MLPENEEDKKILVSLVSELPSVAEGFYDSGMVMTHLPGGDYTNNSMRGFSVNELNEAGMIVELIR